MERDLRDLLLFSLSLLGLLGSVLLVSTRSLFTFTTLRDIRMELIRKEEDIR